VRVPVLEFIAPVINSASYHNHLTPHHYTPNSEPLTLNPEPLTPNPQPSNSNPVQYLKPPTPNPSNL